MKCYNHHDQDAVGTCKQCYKGLCPSCAVDVGGGIACQATCVEAVTQINSLIKANAAASAMNVKKGVSYIMPMFLVALGILFMAESVVSGRPFKAVGFSVISGAVFLGFGLILALYQRSWHARIKGRT